MLRRDKVKRILGVVVVLLAAFAATAQAQLRTDHRLARTTAPDSYVNIDVTMTDTKFTLSRHTGPAGSDARFILHNIGKKAHSFQLGTAKSGIGFQSGFNALVKPGQQKILILYLDYRGAKVPYFGNLPADRNKPGMKGMFTVGNCLKVSAQQVDGC